jgi:tRNA nucleotidyltransferase/poly(A) polymerase
MEFETFIVGGFLRDRVLGIPSKDLDFTVLAPSFDAMRDALVADGFTIHTEKPEFVTIRCGVPKGHRFREHARDADFVLARKDSATGDGRRPDFVEPGTLLDDLSRRDFTANAFAENAVTGEIIDPFGGVTDCLNKTLRFVGSPEQRITEDGLRVLRGFRFMVTKGFCPTGATMEALFSELATEMLAAVSVERIREELERMFAHDTLLALRVFDEVSITMRKAIFRDGLRLSATLAK